jgi:hypothetical protein
MMDCAKRESMCSEHSDDAGKSCGTMFAYPYFISFYIICSFLVSQKTDYNRNFPMIFPVTKPEMVPIMGK